MRITADTGILLRANVKASGPAREILHWVARGGSVLVLSPFLIAEVGRALTYPRVQAIYRLTDDEIREHIEYLEAISELVVPAEGPPLVPRDPDDDPVIYTAVAGAADVICTLDRHFYEPGVLAFCSRRRIRIMTDVELIKVLRDESL